MFSSFAKSQPEGQSGTVLEHGAAEALLGSLVSDDPRIFICQSQTTTPKGLNQESLKLQDLRPNMRAVFLLDAEHI
jgi:hypothetical protein